MLKKSDAHQKEQLARHNAEAAVSNENLAARLGDHEALVSKLAAGLDEKDSLIARLSAELKKAEAYSKQYRLINNKMSNEMDRMVREVESLRSAIN